MKGIPLRGLLLLVPLAFFAGCNRQSMPATTTAAPPHHVHHPPHGGTPVVLGDEIYHLELVRNAGAGKLQVYVLDGEMEDFIRSAVPSITIVATVGDRTETLVLHAVANPATGETVGDTSLFEAQADWLKTTADFDGVLQSITIRGTTFTDVDFNFPEGNDED